MTRRILALACMLMILVGVCAGGFTAQGATEYYQVGYSKMDINPWVDPKDPSQGIILAGDDTKGIPLSGYSTAENRIATSMLDDNGDGNVDAGDGLFTTCTVVVDPDGSMIFFLTLDAISGYGGITGKVRTAVVSAIAELGGTVTADRIMVTGSHSHTGPNMDGLISDETDTARCTYYQYIIDQMTAAAVNAYNDSKNSQATMKKRELDVSEQYGYQMNWVRHINVPLTLQKVKDKWIGSDETTVLGTGSNVFGSNFGIRSDKTLDEERGFGYTTTTKLVGDTANAQHVADADDTLRLLTFEFTDGREPIVLVNWRAHPDNIGNNGSNKYISSDYVGALRYRLEENKTKFGGTSDYRVGYWQGASGNINTHSAITSNEPWVTTTTAPSASYTAPAYQKSDCPYVKYGYMLAEAALLNLEGGKGTATTCDVGGIVNRQIKTFTVDRQIYSEELKQAALDLLAYVNTGKTGTNVYASPSDYINRGGTEASFPYTGSTGGILNSIYHWNKVYEQTQKELSATVNTEINVLMIGEKTAFVTSACELFDRYDADQSTKNEDNDWLELVDEETYGTPFILAYTNGHGGYISNTMAYNYNEGEEIEGYDLVGTGSYEANTAVYAEGTGEKLVATYKKMLSDLNGDSVDNKYCPACKTNVDWHPVYAEYRCMTLVSGGHYYLADDMLYETQRVLQTDEKICIDLRGKQFVSDSRAFMTQAEDKTAGTPAATGVVLSIMDSVGGGSMKGTAQDNNPSGGTFNFGTRNTLNLYGGTFGFTNSTNTKFNGTGIGGVAALTGTMNVYGDTVIEGATLNDSSYAFSSDGCGGAIYMYGGAELNMYGGQITSGTLPTTNDLPTEGADLVAAGPCVYMSAASCKVKLYNAASVEDIYYRSRSGSNVTINGTYTGTANLSFHSSITPSKGLDIGDVSSDIDLSGATLTYTNETADLPIVPIGTNLTIGGYKDTTVAVIGATEYSSLQAAVDAYSGTMIKLIKNEANAVTVDEGKDVYLDLNGCSVNNTVTVTGNYTLYCKDTATDDYTVSDGIYGRIKAVSGNVKGIPEDSNMADDGYLKVTETDGTSFHRVNLDLTHMTLRAEDNGEPLPSVYYKSNFKGDEKVAAAVEKYGVALSVRAMPDAANLDEKCEYSSFDTFKSGSTGNSGNGTLLKGIMKTTNAPLRNYNNANMGIYGRAYIQTADGYMFGGGYKRTLKQQTEAADTIWSTMTDTQKQSIITMYETYSSIMESWNMPNLSTAMGPSQDGALKVLVIGNSHGLDATNLLYEVFKDQNYTKQDLVLGALYYSGCNMSQHAQFMTGNQAVYEYYENDGSNADGSWNVTKGTVADTALNAHQWDIVVLQQMNHRAAMDSTTEYGTYKAADFKTVINYVKERQIGIPKFGWHMVWTNPDGEEYLDPDSSLSHPTKTNTDWVDVHNKWFPGTDGSFDQSVMYQKIVACTQKYIEGDVSFLGSDVFDFVIPSATAVEYAQDVLGLTQAQIYRDYTHMNDYGRLIAAYTWYAKIMGLDQIPAVGIDAIPAVLHHSKSAYPTADSGYAVTDDMKKLIRNAVNYALDNPYELPAEEDNTVSILGIGNSYTIDSMWMLGEVYKAENPGKNVELGIAYKSGENLAGHVKNINENSALYTYYELDTSTGNWKTTSNMTLKDIIAKKNWETVSMQQSSTLSGVASTYNSNIQTIQNTVESVLGYKPTYLWNMTWAYPVNDIEGDAFTTVNTTNGFATYYGSSQATMYKKIVETVQAKILPDATFEYLMPVGTAIQNANATLDDPNLYRDYTHLNDFSRVIAAYVWYSELELVTLDEIQMTVVPAALTKSYVTAGGSGDMTLTADQISLIAACVKNAMLDNFTTTDASVYE